MMKKICILVVAVCMVLSACSNKTNNVKFSEFNSEYVPVNEITDTYSEALKLEYAPVSYTHLTLPTNREV